VIGMDVRVDDVKDPHAARLGGAQVSLDIPDGSTTAPQALPPQPQRYEIATGSVCENGRSIISIPASGRGRHRAEQIRFRLHSAVVTFNNSVE